MILNVQLQNNASVVHLRKKHIKGLFGSVYLIIRFLRNMTYSECIILNFQLKTLLPKFYIHKKYYTEIGYIHRLDTFVYQ